MIKKIKVDQLEPGMFVYDFHCGWLHHPCKDLLRITEEYIKWSDSSDTE